MNKYRNNPMKDVAALVSGIESKLEKLIGQHQVLRDTNKRHIAEIEGLQKTISEQQQTISLLENRINTLKIAKTLEIKEGNVEVKSKINELVREIDKCIGLLNT
jgi:archaellum component FlaC